MALRSLDNALPLTQERPKKQAKVSVAAKLNVVNDENVAPLPAVTIPEAVDYISSDDLQPLADPDLKIQSLMEGLESKDWVKVCESLNDARRFALFHSDLLLPISDKVMLVQVKAMKNPRSALCKIAIMATSDIFKSYGDKLLDDTNSDALDQMLLQLLLKASQDKKFVCEEAEKALKIMVDFIAPLPILQKLRVYCTHANPRVRAKAAVTLSRCVSKMELEGMKEFGLVPLIQMTAKLTNDKLPEAREAARSMTSLSTIDALAVVKIVS
ncbi:TOG domain-containing protein [Heracleum sosnowskyi]|uniref:TOG domain-containing protein n=1 Tax=Heracleum sosnowskyi TaxID=360622 RepID=A0AAD8IKV3_9APIA|nr:TOG domain-containing protein [Heracleum sosnowskyi]